MHRVKRPLQKGISKLFSKAYHILGEHIALQSHAIMHDFDAKKTNIRFILTLLNKNHVHYARLINLKTKQVTNKKCAEIWVYSLHDIRKA